MFEFIRNWWPLLLFSINTLVSIGGWAATRALATKEDLSQISSRISDLDRRLSATEQYQRDSPTVKDMNAFHLELERLRGEMQTFRAEVRGQRETTTAQLTAARDLVVRTERMVGLLTEHEVRGKGGHS
jgi:cob(I)alamin adenosyltransferase